MSLSYSQNQQKYDFSIQLYTARHNVGVASGTTEFCQVTAEKKPPASPCLGDSSEANGMAAMAQTSTKQKPFSGRRRANH